jgi:hypothetical protein
MKVISSIEDEELTEKILKHLGFWDVKARPGSKGKVSDQGWVVGRKEWAEIEYVPTIRCDDDDALGWYALSAR